MYCDKREHLIGKIILDNFLLTRKLEEYWLIKIYNCIDLKTNKEYIIKLVRYIIYVIDKIGKKIR